MLKRLALILGLAPGLFSAGASARTAKFNCLDLEFAKTKLSIAASNFVNVNTTRTHDGSFYRRKLMNGCFKGQCAVVESGQFKMVYEPGHPDANKKGYVKYPDIIKRYEYSAINSAVQELKTLAEHKICKTVLLESNEKDTLIIRFSPDHPGDVFTFEGDKVKSWTSRSEGSDNTLTFNN